jgi:hypothetical protein
VPWQGNQDNTKHAYISFITLPRQFVCTYYEHNLTLHADASSVQLAWIGWGLPFMLLGLLGEDLAQPNGLDW